MSARSDNCLLVWDVGTSSVKAALFDRELRLLGQAEQALTLYLPGPRQAEQDPQQWWSALIASSAAVLRSTGIAAGRVKWLSIASQMAGCVPVDAQGEALRPAIIWLDTRSAAQAQRMMHGFPRVSGYGLWRLLRWLHHTNGAPSLAGKDPVSKYLWLREREPQVWQRTAHLLDVKDYLLLRLTGEIATTPDCAHLTWLMDSRTRQWSAPLLQAVDIEQRMLPPILANDSPVGTLLPAAAQALGLAADTRVVAGAGDVSACALGCGASGPGQPHLYLGTSAWVAMGLERRKVDPLRAIGSLCAPDPLGHLYIATQETAGGALNWAAKVLGATDATGQPDFACIDGEAAASPPLARGARFQPWLLGERVPVDDPRLRGGFLGLGMQHGRGDLLRAVMEGVALNTRWAVESMAGSVRLPDDPLPLCGGVANSDLWCQILADGLQRPVARVQAPKASVARGAAILAARAAGWLGGGEEATAQVGLERVFEPRADLAGAYQEAYRGFLRGHRGVSRLYRGQPGFASAVAEEYESV